MRRVGIVGCGTVGSSVALEFAFSGRDVAACTRSERSAWRASERVDHLLETLVELDLVTRDEAVGARGRIAYGADLGTALAGADHVVETAPEDLASKRLLLAEIEKHVDDDVVIATGTSSLSVTEIAADCVHPDRVLATTYTLPAHLLPVVTVMPGEQTRAEFVAAAVRLLVDVGKEPVVLERDTPGGIAPRLLMALMREACRLLDDGVADPRTIDRAITGGIGRRLCVTGVFDRMDVAGLDTVATALTRRGAPLPAALAEKLAAGALGRKAGRGFYDWSSDHAARFDGAETEHLLHLAKRDRGRLPAPAARAGTRPVTPAPQPASPAVAAEIAPGVLDEFLRQARHEYARCTPDSPPRCFAVLLGHADGGLVEVRSARFAGAVRAEDPSASGVWNGTIIPRFGPAYGNERRGWWANPRDLLAINRAADAEGLDIVGSIHLHPDWHRIGPQDERGMRISEEPTAMDSYLFGMTRWPLNVICYLERDGNDIRHMLAAWAPPPEDDPDGGCARIPLYGAQLTVPPVHVP